MLPNSPGIALAEEIRVPHLLAKPVKALKTNQLALKVGWAYDSLRHLNPAGTDRLRQNKLNIAPQPPNHDEVVLVILS
jgi:hypothetical protein